MTMMTDDNIYATKWTDCRKEKWCDVTAFSRDLIVILGTGKSALFETIRHRVDKNSSIFFNLELGGVLTENLNS